jgi:uncharacterized alpha-E superfamily protein
MLARTADNLFWMARYIERADFLARIVEATLRLEALPRTYGGAENEWESTLSAAGVLESFNALYPTLSDANAIAFLTFDKSNPSSIRNCVEAARRNARAVRTALTLETWESINTGWLDLKRFESIHDRNGGFNRDELASFLSFAKKISLDADGSAYRTMLRNDVYWFSRLGLYVERADNTARILDVKYHVLLPETEKVGGSLDYFQWTAILRAVSALTAYHWVYRESVRPWHIADLLILKSEMPRSLISCYENIVRFEDALAKAYGRQGPSQRRAREVLTRLENLRIEQIFGEGLHEFITRFLEDNYRLGTDIAEQYLLA